MLPHRAEDRRRRVPDVFHRPNHGLADLGVEVRNPRQRARNRLDADVRPPRANRFNVTPECGEGAVGLVARRESQADHAPSVIDK